MYYSYKPSLNFVVSNLIALKIQIDNIIQTNPFLEINLINIDHIDSSGICLILNLYKKLKSIKGDLKFINIKKDIEDLFDITEISSFYKEEKK